MAPLSWDDPAALAGQLRALPALDKAAVRAEQGDVLVDAWVPGAPLLISFAFVDWQKPGDFYLYGRSKKLEGLAGRPLNRIMLRDRRNRWYLNGVQGVGDSVEQVVARLKALIAVMQPSEVWCIGESMGGYGAILHGILLDADRIVSFGALSSFSPDFAERYRDMRWHATMAELGPNPVAFGTDLPALARKHVYAKPLHLVLGTSAGRDAPHAVNLDVMHGQRFADLPGVRYHYYPEGEHAVTAWLVAHKQFDDILLHCLFDAPDPTQLPDVPIAQPAAGAPLAQWPEHFAALDAASAAVAFDSSVLVHAITPGAPLLICFSDGQPGQPIDFEFVRERPQLEAVYGKPLNQIVLRDRVGQAWLRGVRGLGADPEGIAASLRVLIERMQPERVVCIGHGLGGFAALLIGALLDADRIVAISPVSLLDARHASVWHDGRHQAALNILDHAPVAPGPRDLLPVLARYRGKAYIACCAYGAGEGHDVGSHDAVHAERLATLPNVHVQAWPVTDGLLGWLRERKLLLGLLGYGGLK